MKIRTQRNRLLASTMIGGMAIMLNAGVAHAQTTGPVENAPSATNVNSQGANVADAEEIIVTGSRIPQPNLTATSPVTVINDADIKLQGTVRIEDMVNSLPQAFASQGGNLSNGATGTATVNLRNLGSTRTLVLVNGRRMMPGDPSSSAADLNAIPASIVKRVDVLTGGASSVYGSDAVAGVVNFVLDTDFEGFRIDGQYSFFQHNNNGTVLDAALARRGFNNPQGNTVDGGAVDVTAMLGGSFDDGRGHAVGYIGYRKLDKVTQDQRDYSACASQARTPAQVAADPARLLDCGGSATSANGTFFDWNSNTWQIGANRTFIPGSTPFNFAPTNYYQRPDERYTAGFFANYEINDTFKPYLEAMLMDDRTVAQIAASGNFGNTLSVNCDNPLLSAQQRAIICAPNNLVTRIFETGFPIVEEGQPALVFTDPTTGRTYNRGFLQTLRRNVEGAPRQDDRQHTSYRIVAGMRGDFSSAWSYDGYYLYGRTNFADTYLNDFSITRLNRATDVVTDPATGAAICRSVLDRSDPNCVPYDIFALGGVTPAAVNYLATPGLQRGVNGTQVLSANVTGLLGEYGLQTPWAESGLGVNFGVEYRKETLDFQTDQAFTTGDLSGQGAAAVAVKGSYTVKEAFAETRLPIIENGIVDSLTLEAGYRYSKYEISNGNSFSTDAYKFGVDFAPVRDVRFRASYNRAVRAPNIQELFSPNIVALNGNGDPCTGATPDFTAAQCALTGVSAAQYGQLAGNPAGQYNGLIGGNADLQPEKATTKSLGVVLQPSFLPGFAATVDWFDIKVKDVIQPIGQDVILEQCGLTGAASFCSLIHRDATGSLWRSPSGFIEDRPLNLGSFKVRGIDVNTSYSREIGEFGTANLSFTGTWTDKWITDNGVSAPYDCTGLYGLVCGTPTPEWRHRMRVGFNMPNGFGISAGWRYFNSVKLDRTSSNPSLTGAFAPVNEKIPAQSYFDLAATFSVQNSYNFRVGVQNLLDRDPPIIGSNGSSAVINACPGTFCSGNTFPQVYDALGRYIYVGVTLDF